MIFNQVFFLSIDKSDVYRNVDKKFHSPCHNRQLLLTLIRQKSLVNGRGINRINSLMNQLKKKQTASRSVRALLLPPLPLINTSQSFGFGYFLLPIKSTEIHTRHTPLTTLLVLTETHTSHGTDHSSQLMHRVHCFFHRSRLLCHSQSLRLCWKKMSFNVIHPPIWGLRCVHL